MNIKTGQTRQIEIYGVKEDDVFPQADINPLASSGLLYVPAHNGAISDAKNFSPSDPRNALHPGYGSRR